MDKKKLYISPLITKIDIDKTVSMAMESEPMPDDPFGKRNKTLPPFSYFNENDSLSWKFNNPLELNSFTENPFKLQ